MDTNTQRLAESKYRRGTVLGLTVAEIFILLLFLLMLVFLVLWQDLQQELEPLREFRSVWEAPLDEVETPDRLRELREFQETWAESLEGIDTPDEIHTLQELKEDVERSLGDAGEETIENLVEAQSARNDAEEENRRLEGELAEAEARLSEVTEELRALSRGQNPPCWYEVVSDGAGGTREKPLYTVDIGVFDDHMVIRHREPPAGRAVNDDNGIYADEWGELGLADTRYDVPLSDNELTAELRRIHEAGKQGRVRRYPCVFYVSVWDETSSDAKARWQQAHDRTLEWLFGTYHELDAPW